MTIDVVQIRLADEGVPLRAIARATSTPSDVVREQLAQAQADGRLLALPKEDWPPGFPRDQRALQLSRMVVEDRATVALTMRRVFGLTQVEGGLLLTLLQNQSVSRDRIDMEHRTVDVHICHLRRRLAPFGIAIETLRDYGYQLSIDARNRIMDMIMAQVKEQPA